MVMRVNVLEASGKGAWNMQEGQGLRQPGYWSNWEAIGIVPPGSLPAVRCKK